jgi:hypothetical protein
MTRGKGLSEEAAFTVLNPEGIKPEIEIHALSPRLDTLEGKTVNVINLHGGNEVILESIASDLKAAVPGCNVVYYRTDGGQGGPPLTEEDWEKMTACDAAILGHNY